MWWLVRLVREGNKMTAVLEDADKFFRNSQRDRHTSSGTRHQEGTGIPQPLVLALLESLMCCWPLHSLSAREVDLAVCGYVASVENRNDDGELLFFWNRANLDFVELVVGDAAPPLGWSWDSHDRPYASVTVQLALTGIASVDPAQTSLIIEGSWQPRNLVDDDYLTISDGKGRIAGLGHDWDPDEQMVIFNADIEIEFEDVSTFLRGEKLELIFDYFDTNHGNDLGFPGDVPFRATRFALSSPTLVFQGDLNGDGSVDGFDIDPFVFLLTSGLEAYQQQFSANPDPLLVADLTRDGAIDGFDISPFVELLTGAGASADHPRTVAIPEPSTLVFAGVMCVCLKLVRLNARRSCAVNV